MVAQEYLAQIQSTNNNLQLGTSVMINHDFLNLMKLTFQKFLGMCHYELLQTKNVPISRWLLHLQGKVKQVRIIRILLSHLFRQIVAGIKNILSTAHDSRTATNMPIVFLDASKLARVT